MKLKKIGVMLVAAAFVVSAGAGTADAAKGGGSCAAGSLVRRPGRRAAGA